MMYYIDFAGWFIILKGLNAKCVRCFQTVTLGGHLNCCTSIYPNDFIICKMSCKLWTHLIKEISIAYIVYFLILESLKVAFESKTTEKNDKIKKNLVPLTAHQNSLSSQHNFGIMCTRTPNPLIRRSVIWFQTPPVHTRWCVLGCDTTPNWWSGWHPVWQPPPSA